MLNRVAFRKNATLAKATEPKMVDANAKKFKNSHVKNVETEDWDVDKIKVDTKVETISAEGHYQNMTSWPVQ